MSFPSIAVITGANRGLGRAAAERLATEGHRVIATARQVATLKPLCAELSAVGERIERHALDVTDDASIEALRAWVAERFGRIDVLINNSGVSLEPYSARLSELPLETLRETLETNLFGVLRVTRALLPLMRGSRAGRIVNLSSEMGQLANMQAGAPAYRISKTALNAVTRILSAELADIGIKVNSVCPGWCRTDIGGPNAPRSPEQGVDSVVWLATLPQDGPTGGFFHDRERIAW